MDVEAVSVSHVQLTIGECPHLTPFIDQKDKVPFTDGHIDIRTEEGSPKDTNFAARAQVQVKGRTLGQGRKPAKSFSLKRTKLDGYLKIGGLLLLVVNISKQAEKHIQYALLTPLQLDRLLKQKPKQKSFSVNLKLLPKEHSDIEAIVKYMAQAHNENPEALANDHIWERARDITVFTSHRLDVNKPVRLNPKKHDFTVKVTTQDGAQAFAQGNEYYLVPESYIGVPFGKPVRSGEVVFQEPQVRQLNEDTVALDLSETLSLHRSRPVDGREQGLIRWDMNDSFDKRLKDLGFVLSAVDNGGYFVGELFLEWDLGSLTDEEELRRHYRHLCRTAELFEFIGARTDLLDLSTMEEKRHEQLWHLYDALIEKKQMTPDKPTRAGRILQPIGEWALELFARETSEQGKFRIYHLLDQELQHMFYAHNETGEKPAGFPVTAYELLKEDGDFSRILNLGLDRIVNIYSAISEYSHTSDTATGTVLELIKAADHVTSRQEEFLTAADSLNEWHIARYGEAPHKTINALQIQYRRRTLSPEERSQLRNLRRQVLRDEVEMAAALAFSCSVLLNDPDEAEDHFHTLSKEQQEVMRQWPIWTLWTPKEN